MHHPHCGSQQPFILFRIRSWKTSIVHLAGKQASLNSGEAEVWVELFVGDYYRGQSLLDGMQKEQYVYWWQLQQIESIAFQQFWECKCQIIKFQFANPLNINIQSHINESVQIQL